jgi:hypothetical protein
MLAILLRRREIYPIICQSFHPKRIPIGIANDAKTKIIAPCNGKVLEWKIQPGEGIASQQTIAQIAPSGNTIVEGEIDESMALKAKIGQLVEVNYLGSKDVIAKGKIYFLSEYLRKKSMFSEQSGEAEDRRVRIVKVMLENPQGLLFNAKVEVKISTK